jgi:hypothetical protein
MSYDSSLESSYLLKASQKDIKDKEKVPRNPMANLVFANFVFQPLTLCNSCLTNNKIHETSDSSFERAELQLSSDRMPTRFETLMQFCSHSPTDGPS